MLASVVSGLDAAWRKEIEEVREPLYRKPASIAIKSAAVQIAQALIHDGLADDAQLILDWLDKREPVEGIFRGKAYL